MRRSLLLAISMVCSLLAVAQAADQTVLGSSLVIKNPSAGEPEKRKIAVKAKEVGSDNTIVGDVLTNGAGVTIRAFGDSPSSDGFSLPVGTSAATGKPFWSGDAVKGYKYGDPKGENGAVKRAQLKHKGGVFQLKILIDGKLGNVLVTPPDLGTDACVIFTIGAGDSYNVKFASGQIINKGILLFKVVKPTAQGVCVQTTMTTTSSTSSTTATPTTSTSSTTTSTIPIPLTPPPGASPLRYRDLVFASATVTTNITYGSAVNLSGQTVTLQLDLYEPTGDLVIERPAIVWVHGGSFAFGDKSSAELVDEATVFSRKGYVNVSINYRLEPPGCSAGAPTVQCVQAIAEAMEDAQTAVRFLRTNAATYGIDVDRIAIGGSSAGAITALNVGFDSSEDPSAAVGGAVSLSGANLLGAVDVNDAPSLLFHGTSDNVVPYAWAVDTFNDANAVGLDSFLTSWTGAGHVPYVAHRTEILDQTTNFLWWEMDLANAAQ